MVIYDHRTSIRKSSQGVYDRCSVYSTQGPCNLKVNGILEDTALFDTVVSWCKCMALCISYFNAYLFVVYLTTLHKQHQMAGCLLKMKYFEICNNLST